MSTGTLKVSILRLHTGVGVLISLAPLPPPDIYWGPVVPIPYLWALLTSKYFADIIILPSLPIFVQQTFSPIP